MNLIEQAEADLSITLEDVDNGFGVALSFKDQDENFKTINCQTTDIGFFVDPETGAAVSGRTVEISARITTLDGFNISYPGKTQIIKYLDTKGIEYLMKVQQNRPDRKIGIYNLLLEVIK